MHRGAERLGPRAHEATASGVDRRDHGIGAATDAVAPGAGEQPALGVAGHLRVVGEVVQVRDPEVGDHLVDDIGPRATSTSDQTQVRWHAGGLRPVEQARHGGIGIGQGRVRSPTSTTTSAPSARTCDSSGARQWQVQDDPGRAGGQRGDHVARRGLGHLRWGAAARGQHGAPLLGGQHRQQRLRRHATAHVAQVVPPRPGRCSMPAVTSRPPRRRSRSTTTDGRPGGREPAPDGERERARPEATGGPDHGGEAL